MLLLFLLSLFGIVLVFAGYPIVLYVLARLIPRPYGVSSSHIPSVTLIVACHNPGALLEKKIANSLALDYPEDRFKVLIVSDGSNDGTAEALASFESDRVQGVVLPHHDGKAAALNRGIELATSQVLVFSDVDAELPRDTLRLLVRHFANDEVGGVCGQRTLRKGRAELYDAQASYVGWDSRIKTLETQIGSTTSNDGKLYAVRRDAAGPIAEGVTDDLYAAIGVIRRGWRFVFDERALAVIPTPAKSPEHEISRRRRVVSRSLRGIYLQRKVLNIGRLGGYAIAMIINKVVRRLLPLLLALMLVSNIALAADSTLFAATLLAQLAFYGVAALGALRPRANDRLGAISRRAYYALLGMIGTALGVWDFARGRTVVTWQPAKDVGPTDQT